MGFPESPGVKTLLPPHGPSAVRFLAGELRSHILLSQENKKVGEL